MTEAVLIVLGAMLGSVVAIWASKGRGDSRRLPTTCSVCLAPGVMTSSPFDEPHLIAFAGYGLLTAAAPWWLALEPSAAADPELAVKFTLQNAKSVFRYAIFATGFSTIGALTGIAISAFHGRAEWRTAAAIAYNLYGHPLW